MPAKLPTHRPKRQPDHAAKERERARRASRYLSYSGKQWQAIRKAQLQHAPLCQHCGQPATDVDHIEGDTAKNIVGVDLQSLCHACHSVKTQADEHYRRTGKRLAIKGCDVDGLPRDPWHPWSVEQRQKSLEGDSHNTARPPKRAAPRN